MNSLMFAHSKKAYKEMQVYLQGIRDSFVDYEYITPERLEEIIIKSKNDFLKQKEAEFIGILKMHEFFNNTFNQYKDKWFAITIRPKTYCLEFEKFFEAIKKLLSIKSFSNITISFEQEGLNIAELGKGYHCHIICKNKSYNGKAQLLRAIFKNKEIDNLIILGYMEKQGVHIEVAHSHEKFVEQYLTEYDSKDGHKIITKETDRLWRKLVGLRFLYNLDEDILSLNKPSLTERECIPE